MRIGLVTLAMLLTALTAGAQEHVATSLTAMTFNVRYGAADDGPDSWEHRKDLLVDTIREHEPDVLGLQECLEFQAEYIQEQLEGYMWIGMGRDVGATGEMTAIFYRKAFLAPVELEHFWLSEEPDRPGSVSWDSSLTRMATRIKFYHRHAHEYFTVINTHFDHKGVQAREKSAELLRDRVKELPEDQPLLVMGDFNSVAESTRPWETLIEAGLKDTWLETTDKSGPDPVTTWSGFGKPRQRTEPFRIDWILTRGPVKVFRTEIVTKNDNGRYPSDHFPVVSKLMLWAE